MATSERTNIVDISSRFSEPPPIDVQPVDYLGCRHDHTVVDGKLRTVACADCREERLDPIEVLLSLAREWRRWQYEAEKLNDLNREYRNNQREAWERARDRHLNAHNDHRVAFVPGRGSYTRGTQPCRQCYSLELRYRREWYPTPAKEPPPGPLQEPTPAAQEDERP